MYLQVLHQLLIIPSHCHSLYITNIVFHFNNFSNCLCFLYFPQILAFQILLDENHLSLEDQDKALQNIKDGMEKLQQDYRDAKEENEFMRRQGLSSGEGLDMEFDENKDVEGELYKLNMKLDDLEHRVQGNLKQKSTRVPYKVSPLSGSVSFIYDASRR